MASMQELEAQIKEMAAQMKGLMTALEFANSKLEAHDKKIEKKYYEKRPQKFWTLASRYVNGKFIVADPEHPAVVVFGNHLKIAVRDDGVPEDGTLIPYEDSKDTPAVVPDTNLAKPYAEIRRGPTDRKAHDMDKTGNRRPSDVDPAGQ